MNAKLADQMREAMESRRVFGELEPHVRAGVVMVKQLRTYLMVFANRVNHISEIRYDLGTSFSGNLVSTLAEAKITHEAASTETFHQLFTNYVNYAMAEEGIAVKWLPHELTFSFIEGEEVKA